ncbi:MAG: DUF5110 domain-containing protein [Chitinophagaceae bacterium]
MSTLKSCSLTNGTSTFYEDEGINYNYEGCFFAGLFLIIMKLKSFTIEQRSGKFARMDAMKKFRINGLIKINPAC